MCTWFYNAALEHRKTAYKQSGVTVGLYDQNAELTQIRAEMPEWEDLAVQLSRGVLRRIDRAFTAFFSRIKAGETPGYPRFKPRQRFRTLEMAGVQSGMVKQSPDGRRAWLSIKGLPRLVFRTAGRPLPDGKLKGILLTRKPTGWFASLQYEVEREPLPKVIGSVGIDVGVRKRLALSTTETIIPRKLDRSRENGLRQQVGRAQKGGNNRRKRVRSLSRETYRNAVRNRNECHRLTTGLVRRFGLIALEDLKLRNMTRRPKPKSGGRNRGSSPIVSGPGNERSPWPNRGVAAKRGLNRSILEQTLGLIRQQLIYKAEWAGRRLELVSAKNTSRTCSRCGVIDAENRNGERYECTHCGMKLDADINAAISILRRAHGAREYRAALL